MRSSSTGISAVWPSLRIPAAASRGHGRGRSCHSRASSQRRTRRVAESRLGLSHRVLDRHRPERRPVIAAWTVFRSPLRGRHDRQGNRRCLHRHRYRRDTRSSGLAVVAATPPTPFANSSVTPGTSPRSDGSLRTPRSTAPPAVKCSRRQHSRSSVRRPTSTKATQLRRCISRSSWWPRDRRQEYPDEPLVRMLPSVPVGRSPGVREQATADCDELGLDEAAADCVACEVDAVAHAELAEDVGAVAFDGFDAENERRCDFL
jgi:hypothetical protein